MDTSNWDLKIKRKAIIELAELGYSIGVVASILGMRSSLAARMLTEEFEIYNMFNRELSVKEIEKHGPFSILSQIKSYSDICEITIFYKIYLSICKEQNDNQPNPFVVALAFHNYFKGARDRRVVPLFVHVNQAYYFVSQIHQGIITVSECPICKNIVVYPNGFKKPDCPLCRLKQAA